jgi:hypothetical protein
VLFEYEIKRSELHSKITAIHRRTNTEPFAELFCSTTCLRDLFLAGKHDELSQTRWCRKCREASNMHLRHERKAQWMVFERKQAGQFWLHELIVHDADLFGTLPSSTTVSGLQD